VNPFWFMGSISSDQVKGHSKEILCMGPVEFCEAITYIPC